MERVQSSAIPGGAGDDMAVAGTALLGHDRHQFVSTEPDRRQPIVLGHGEKVPAGREIVKSRCRALFCHIRGGSSSCQIPITTRSV